MTIRMNRFDNMFRKTLSECNAGLLGTDADSDGYLNISPMIFQNLLIEAITQTDLDPIPKPVLDYVCSKVRTKMKNSIRFSYDELYELLKSKNYPDADKFMMNLQELGSYDSGYLQIGVCSDSADDFKKFFQSAEMPIERLMNFWQSCRNDVSGNTFSGDPLLMAKFKNACIFLNIDHIKQNSTWKDTLSHELSHFLQRVVITDESTVLGKIEKSNLMNPKTGLQWISTDIEVQKDFHKMFIKFFSKTSLKYSYLASLYKNTLCLREEHTTIQNILNGFQRMYEQQKAIDGKPSYKKLEANHDASIYKKQRFKWLDDLLMKVNDPEFYRNEGKWIIDEFMSSPHQKLTSPWKIQQRWKNAIIILQYLGVKNLMNEYSIDERLHEHFSAFKFRDN